MHYIVAGVTRRAVDYATWFDEPGDIAGMYVLLTDREVIKTGLQERNASTLL